MDRRTAGVLAWSSVASCLADARRCRRNMADRPEAVAGKLEVGSAAGAGTRVRERIPVPRTGAA